MPARARLAGTYLGCCRCIAERFMAKRFHAGLFSIARRNDEGFEGVYEIVPMLKTIADLA